MVQGEKIATEPEQGRGKEFQTILKQSALLARISKVGQVERDCQVLFGMSPMKRADLNKGIFAKEVVGQKQKQNSLEEGTRHLERYLDVASRKERPSLRDLRMKREDAGTWIGKARTPKHLGNVPNPTNSRSTIQPLWLQLFSSLPVRTV